MEGSSEVRENTKHEGLARAINHPMPGEPSECKRQMQFTVKHLPTAFVVQICC